MRPLSLLFILFLFYQNALAQNSCEQVTTAALQKLPTLIQQNEYNQIKLINQTIEATCGKTEFTQRLDIIYNLINRQSSNILIHQYLFDKMDYKLKSRWTAAMNPTYNAIYSKKKSIYEYIPLRHAVDSLLKVKAIALLKSDNYSLSQSQQSILYLFAENIEEFANTTTGHNSVLSQKQERQYDSELTFGIHAGVFTPLSKDNYYFTAPTFGISVLTPLKHRWVGEFQYKLRADSKAKNILVHHDKKDLEINAQSLHNLSLGIGYQVLNSNKWIILPKLNFGIGFIWTGIDESIVQLDEYGDEYESISYKNINTLHSTAGISIMKNLSKKLHIGSEISFHYIPYTADSKLISPIQSKYASWEIFFRF